MSRRYEYEIVRAGRYGICRKVKEAWTILRDSG